MRHTLRSLRERRGKARTGVRDLIRRMAVVAHAGAEFILEGYEDADGYTETEVAEPFGVAGVYSRLATQAIVAKVGGTRGHAVIIATSNRDVLELLAGGIADGEAGILNNVVSMRLRPGGTVDVATHTGTAAELAKASALDDLKEIVDTSVDFADFKTKVSAWAIDATSVLRGE